MNAQRVLVTGANSPLAQSVATRLRSLGHIPVGTIRPHSLKNFVSIFEDIFPVDFNEHDTVGRIKGSFDSVIHIAALSHGSATDLMTVTGLGTRALAEQAVKLGISRFVHVSSISVYGMILTSPVNSRTQVHHASDYGVAKWAAECYLHNFSQSFKHVSVRCPAIVGKLVSPHFLARLYQQMCRNEPIIRLNNPEFKFNNVIHETTLSQFLVHLALENTGCPTVLPIASSEPVRLVEIVSEMANATAYRGQVVWASGIEEPFSIDNTEAIEFGLDSVSTRWAIQRWLSHPTTVREVPSQMISIKS